MLKNKKSYKAPQKQQTSHYQQPKTKKQVPIFLHKGDTIVEGRSFFSELLESRRRHLSDEEIHERAIFWSEHDKS